MYIGQKVRIVFHDGSVSDGTLTIGQIIDNEVVLIDDDTQLNCGLFKDIEIKPVEECKHFWIGKSENQYCSKCGESD